MPQMTNVLVFLAGCIHRMAGVFIPLQKVLIGTGKSLRVLDKR